MEETEKQAAWEGEFYRDMVTYRFIDLSASALEAAFENDDGLADKYADWLNGLDEKAESEEEPKPVMLSEFEPDDGSDVRVYAVPNQGEFFVLFKTEDFETSVSLSYDAERMDIGVARIAKFAGDTSAALAWAEAFKAMLDDMLVSQMQGGEEDEEE